MVFLALVAGAVLTFYQGSLSKTSTASSSSAQSSTNQNSAAVSDATKSWTPTPIIAQSNGIDLHCAVSVNDLTEILIHNASYDYACALTTELTEADNESVLASHGTGRVASSQPTGDHWLTGYYIRCFRSGNAGPKQSAIDCGAEAGTTVYAPVTGTVVRVLEYNLYDNENYKDYRVHIQPDGNSSLDVVSIHLTDVSVKVGDHVTAGQTVMAKVRDVYAYIGYDMQLKDYTAENDNGNHVHIQVNDKTNANYHGLD